MDRIPGHTRAIEESGEVQNAILLGEDRWMTKADNTPQVDPPWKPRQRLVPPLSCRTCFLDRIFSPTSVLRIVCRRHALSLGFF